MKILSIDKTIFYTFKSLSIIMILTIILTGCTGKPGADGQDGIDGKDGKTPTIEISAEGYWVINGVVTKNKAIGIDGKDGLNGQDGKDGLNGQDGKDGLNGQDGKDGLNGQDGKDGLNGQDGKDGLNGQDGETPTIEINENGYFVINGVETKYKAVESTLASICDPAKVQDFATDPLEAGYKYECEVKGGVKYNFYVLTTPTEDDTRINLIMDRNICEDGTPTEEEKTCFVKYNSLGTVEDEGPVTAMTYLNNATSSWENIDNLNITYNDEGNNFTNFKITGKARLPYKSELNSVKSKAFLYDNLELTGCNGDECKSLNKISKAVGYWSFSTSSSDKALAAYMSGKTVDGPFTSSNVGVRPVISLKL